MLTFGSLFAGVGGFDIGLERAGLKCLWQVENNHAARAVLVSRWPDVKRWADVRTFPPAQSPKRYFGVDLICGGDPCQENSAARVTTGTRAPSLGAEFVRVVGELRPRFVLRENPTRVRPDAPWPWRRFRDALEGLGYLVLPFRLRSCCFGADHQRDRLFLLAEDADPDRESFWLPRRGPRFSPACRLQTPASEWEWIRAHARAVGRGQRRRSDAGDGRGGDGIPSRVDRLRLLGNSVDPRAVEWIGRRLIAAIAQENEGMRRG